MSLSRLSPSRLFPSRRSGRRPASCGVLVVHPSAELYGSDRVALESAAGFGRSGPVRMVLGAPGPLGDLATRRGITVGVGPMPVLRKSALRPAGLVRLLRDLVRALPAMARTVRESRPEVVYVSTVTAPWWLALGRLYRARVVCHVHEAEEGVPRVVRLALALPLLFAHTVVANSVHARAVLVRDLPALAARTVVVHNGVPGPAAPTAPREHLDGPVRLVLVGRISERKGTDLAVRAVAELVDRGIDAELSLVGGVFPGYEWFDDEVRRIAVEAGVADRVHRLGVLDDVWGALDDADIALVPSRVEPFGNAAVEAMLAHRPVVVGDTQGLPEIVRGPADGERFPPGDAVALADAVGRVVGDWAQVRSGCARIAADARNRFGPERYRTEIARTVLLRN